MTAPTQTPPPSPAAAPRSAATTAIVTATAVAGGIALLAVGVSTTVQHFAPAVVSEDMIGVGLVPAQSEYGFFESVDGVRGLEISAAVSSFRIEAGDQEDAELTVEGSDFADQWSMYRDGDELVVEAPELGAGAVTGGCLFGCSPNSGAGEVTLTLPRELLESGRLEADISLAGGELRGEGSFRELGIDVDAGSLEFTGSARTLDLGLSVGEARVELADVDEAEIDVQTGDATLKLTGTAPRSVELNAEMGAVSLQLPEGGYRVDQAGTLGAIDNQLTEDPKSSQVVRVRGTAAEITLR
ncbi:DUF4097 family beta strand repeat-containing protein [Leucobacter massiliensis]|uniref:DUF4097 domain-containing protein n=1 Tax=Leucobacter massiliensis TaxID=1686285 RepID=A0A2S9QRZ6_9MICO|nr:DUF4097 family beta strand repeat-containing protein [Leucobacter massiliensis]PRI12342.1 hypothetical protein B4915_01290 [Leucobacter massiliensis]